jgi:hypothetical protein
VFAEQPRSPTGTLSCTGLTTCCSSLAGCEASSRACFAPGVELLGVGAGLGERYVQGTRLYFSPMTPHLVSASFSKLQMERSKCVYSLSPQHHRLLLYCTPASK